MKLSTLWKTLNRDQRQAWHTWAKSNPVLLDNGTVRLVAGHKAMTLVLNNRARAGEAANPAQVPAAAAWRDGALSTRDAGPWTDNAGYVGFRAEQDLPAGTKWFVWASAPVWLTDAAPWATLRFITVLNLDAMTAEDVVPSFGGAYQSVQGDWHPPFNPEVNPQAWDPARKIWFRLHHYVDGQLSPGRILSGLIAQEL